MARAYRHQNGRIQARSAGGRFRKWTGDDAGIGVCPKCRTITTRPALDASKPFIDPVDFHARVCGQCGWDSRKPNSSARED